MNLFFGLKRKTKVEPRKTAAIKRI